MYRRFYAAMALLLFAIAFFGFLPNSHAILTGQRENPPLIVHVHAAAMLAWLVLLLTQSTLMAAQKRALHFRLGLAALGLAPIIIKDIYDALPGIVGGGMSAVIVEQDISKALSVSSRVYCLQEGRVSLEADSRGVSRADISRAYFGIE